MIGWSLRTWRTVRATHAPSRSLSSDSSRDSILKPMACEISIKLKIQALQTLNQVTVISSYCTFTKEITIDNLVDLTGFRALACDQTTFTMQTLMFCKISCTKLQFLEVRVYNNLSTDTRIGEGLYFDILIKFYRFVSLWLIMTRQTRMQDWRTQREELLFVFLQGFASLNPSGPRFIKMRSLAKTRLQCRILPTGIDIVLSLWKIMTINFY